MKAVILAGGLGTRLGMPDIPKPMVEITGGVSSLYNQIMLLEKYGIKDIYILSGHKAKVIFKAFGDGSELGVNITHIVEPYRLGTAGSLALLNNIIKERFLLLFGDIFIDIDLKKFYMFDRSHTLDKNGKFTLGSMIVHPNNHPHDSDLVEIDDKSKVVKFHQKPHNKNKYYQNLVSAGAYILSPKIFDFIEFGGYSDLSVILRENIEHEIYAYKTSEYMKDIGTPERLQQVKKDIIDGKVSRLMLTNKRKAVFIDRDGVINKHTKDILSPKEFQLLPGVDKAIKKINDLGYLTVVVTNQPAIAKGFMTREDLHQIHNKMETLLGRKGAYIDAIYYCPHHPEKGFKGEVKSLKIKCKCRKPEPGMLLKAAKDLNIDLKQSWMLGDNMTDVVAGIKAGCESMGVNFLSSKAPSNTSLNDAVDFLIRQDFAKPSIKIVK